MEAIFWSSFSARICSLSSSRSRMISSEDMAESRLLLLLLLPLNEPRDSIKGHAAIVTDDAAAPIGVRESGQNVRAATPPHVCGVGIEDPFVMSFAVLGKRFDHMWIGFVSVGLQAFTTMRSPPFGMMARLRGASV